MEGLGGGEKHLKGLGLRDLCIFLSKEAAHLTPVLPTLPPTPASSSAVSRSWEMANMKARCFLLAPLQPIQLTSSDASTSLMPPNLSYLSHCQCLEPVHCPQGPKVTLSADLLCHNPVQDRVPSFTLAALH